MMELTPEGVREHFPKFKQVVNDYIKEERLKEIATRLLFDEDDIPATGAGDGQIGTTLNGFQTPPVVTIPTSATSHRGAPKAQTPMMGVVGQNTSFSAPLPTTKPPMLWQLASMSEATNRLASVPISSYCPYGPQYWPWMGQAQHPLGATSIGGNLMHVPPPTMATTTTIEPIEINA
jgi:hypothetical protein